jgi:hypothetical protein
VAVRQNVCGIQEFLMSKAIDRAQATICFKHALPKRNPVQPALGLDRDISIPSNPGAYFGVALGA